MFEVRIFIIANEKSITDKIKEMIQERSPRNSIGFKLVGESVSLKDFESAAAECRPHCIIVSEEMLTQPVMDCRKGISVIATTSDISRREGEIDFVNLDSGSGYVIGKIEGSWRPFTVDSLKRADEKATQFYNYVFPGLNFAIQKKDAKKKKPSAGAVFAEPVRGDSPENDTAFDFSQEDFSESAPEICFSDVGPKTSETPHQNSAFVFLDDSDSSVKNDPIDSQFKDDETSREDPEAKALETSFAQSDFSLKGGNLDVDVVQEEDLIQHENCASEEVASGDFSVGDETPPMTATDLIMANMEMVGKQEEQEEETSELFQIKIAPSDTQIFVEKEMSPGPSKTAHPMEKIFQASGADLKVNVAIRPSKVSKPGNPLPDEPPLPTQRADLEDPIKPPLPRAPSSNLASRGEKTFSIALGLEKKPERRDEEKPVEKPQGGTPPVLETASSVVATSQIPPATHKEKKAALPEKTYDLPPRTPPKPPKPIEAARAEAEPVLEGFLKSPSPNKSASPKSEAECSPYVEPVEVSPSMERLLYPAGSYPSSLRSRLLKIPGGKE